MTSVRVCLPVVVSGIAGLRQVVIESKSGPTVISRA
jgi:hypothetical protein